MAAKPKSATAKQSSAAAEESRAEQSVQAFRDALDKSVTISRERLQEVVDDAVRARAHDARRRRGARRPLRHAGPRAGRRHHRPARRGGLSSCATPVPKPPPSRAGPRAGPPAARAASSRTPPSAPARRSRRAPREARKRTVAAVDQPLASADRVKRKARVPGLPISAYDQLSVRQIDTRLARPHARRAAEGPRLRAGPQGPKEPAALARPQAQSLISPSGWTPCSRRCRGSCGARRAPSRARRPTRARSAHERRACRAPCARPRSRSRAVDRKAET